MEETQLLRLQTTHRSSNISNEDLKCKHRMVKTPDKFCNQSLIESGFHFFCTIPPMKIDSSLITAFVERWRPETHTFHLPCGECSITLQDVAIHLGLNVNGPAVTGGTYFDWQEVCQELLGKVPDAKDMKGCELKLTWLTQNFYNTPPPLTHLEEEQCCRAHILNLIGSVILPGKSNSLVHLMYLPLLRDLKRARKYSWGAACLAHLYKELSVATKLDTKSIGGCLLLLQSWIWFRLPHFAPIENPIFVFPRAASWASLPKIFTGKPHGNLSTIRARLDHMKRDEFKWVRYFDYVVLLPPFLDRYKKIWKASVPLICFSTVVWHQVDRVKLQFGLIQDIPEPPMNMDEFHDIDKRGNHDVNWGHRHAEWINLWEDRKNRVIDGIDIIGTPLHTSGYMNWYVSNCLLFLSSDQQLNDPRRNIYIAKHSTSMGQASASNQTMYTPAPMNEFRVYDCTPGSANAYNQHFSSHGVAGDIPGTSAIVHDNPCSSSLMQGHVFEEEEEEPDNQ